MSPISHLALTAALCLAWTAAHADDDASRSMRLIGETAASKTAPARRFIIDARVKPGDGEFQSDVEGWFAGLDDNPPSGSIAGACVEKHCALTVQVDDGKMAFTGDFLDAAGPVTARFIIKDSDDKVSEGVAVLRPVGGPVPGFGPLAAPGAIGAQEMDRLLVWNHASAPTGSRPDEPLGDGERGSLAEWQKAKGRGGPGLVFETDLAELRAGAEAARKAAGWTPLGDAAHGWTAGYPATLLPRGIPSETGPHFTSADGKASLAVIIDPPMTGDAFDALVDRETADNPARSEVGYNRVNGDMDAHYVEKGVVHQLAWHNRDGALARMVFTYPADAADTYSAYNDILTASFQAGDDLKQ